MLEVGEVTGLGLGQVVSRESSPLVTKYRRISTSQASAVDVLGLAIDHNLGGTAKLFMFMDTRLDSRASTTKSKEPGGVGQNASSLLVVGSKSTHVKHKVMYGRMTAYLCNRLKVKKT